PPPGCTRHWRVLVDVPVVDVRHLVPRPVRVRPQSLHVRAIPDLGAAGGGTREVVVVEGVLRPVVATDVALATQAAGRAEAVVEVGALEWRPWTGRLAGSGEGDPQRRQHEPGVRAEPVGRILQRLRLGDMVKGRLPEGERC